MSIWVYINFGLMILCLSLLVVCLGLWKETKNAYRKSCTRLEAINAVMDVIKKYLDETNNQFDRDKESQHIDAVVEGTKIKN